MFKFSCSKSNFLLNYLHESYSLLSFTLPAFVAVGLWQWIATPPQHYFSAKLKAFYPPRRQTEFAVF